MARGRKTPKPKPPSYERIDRKADPLEVYKLLDTVLEEYRQDDLEESKCRIALAWRYGLKRNKDGQLVLGKCKKVSELDKLYAEFDFVIILNSEAWKTLNDGQRKALVHHEVCHIAISTDQNGNTKKDSRGRTAFRIKKHDIEEFGDVVAVHGCYKRDLAQFVEAAVKSAAENAPSLFDTNDANMRPGSAASPQAKAEEPPPAAAEPKKETGSPGESPTAWPLAELWREFPIERLTINGLTEGDVEKLNAGEVKQGSGFPIITLGDLQKFTSPYAHNPSYSRNLTDIRGIGAAAAERIQDANEKFWGWWNGGGAEEFAAEKGIKLEPKHAAEEAQDEPQLRGGTNSETPVIPSEMAVDAAEEHPATIPLPSKNGTHHTNGTAKRKRGKAAAVAN